MYMLLVLYTLGHIVHDEGNVYMYMSTHGTSALGGIKRESELGFDF